MQLNLFNLQVVWHHPQRDTLIDDEVEKECCLVEELVLVRLRCEQRRCRQPVNIKWHYELLVSHIMLIHDELKVDNLWVLASRLNVSTVNHGRQTVVFIVTLLDLDLQDHRQTKVLFTRSFRNLIEQIIGLFLHLSSLGSYLACLRAFQSGTILL